MIVKNWSSIILLFFSETTALPTKRAGEQTRGARCRTFLSFRKKSISEEDQFQLTTTDS